MSLNLEVNILGEYKNLTRATKGASKQLYAFQTTAKKISRSINGSLAAIGVGFSLNAVIGGIKSMVTQASELEQSLGATKAVFGEFSDQITANSKKAAAAFGLSANDYLQSTNLIGAQLKNLGLSTEDYAKRADKLVGLGADLAATFGGTTYDAVQALSAVFRGEYNQVEKYGISIRKSDINARVAETSHKKLTGQMLKQAEALAAIDLLYEQTTASQGQFARETDTMAGSMQIMKAAFATISTTIGEAFIPTIVAFSDWMTTNIPQIQALADAISTKLQAAFANTGDAAQTFGAKVITAITDLTEFLSGTATAGNVFYDLGEKIKPIFDVIGAFGELAKGLVAVLDGLFDGLFGWIGLLSGGEATIGGFAGFVEGLGKILQNVGYWIGQIASFFIPFTKGFTIAGSVIKGFGGIAAKIMGGLGKTISAAFSPIGKFIESVVNGFNMIFKPELYKAGNAVSDFVANVIQKVPGLGGFLKFFTVDIPHAIQGFLNLPIVKTAIAVVDSLVGGFRSLLGITNTGTGTTAKAAAPKLYSGPMIDPKTGKSLIPAPKVTVPSYTVPDTTAADKKAKAKAAADKKAQAAKDAAAKKLQIFKDQVKELVDTVETALEDAQKRIKSASENFRDAVQLSFGIITNGAFAVFDVNRVIRQMSKIKEATKTFVADLKQLSAEGADASLIDQLLGMDPISGATAARGLLSSGKLQEYLNLRKELAGIGSAAGQAGNVATYGSTDTELKTLLGKLNTTLAKGTGDTYNIDITNAANMSATDIINAIKKYEKTAGKKVFSN